MKKPFLFFMLLLVVISCYAADIRTVQYHRYDKQYTGWGLHVWGSGYDGEAIDWGKPLQPKTISEYGAVFEIPYKGEGDLQFIVHKGDSKDPDGDRTYPDPKVNKAIWVITEDAVVYTSLADAKENAVDLMSPNTGQRNTSVRLYYKRFDNNYAGWGLHVWGAGYTGTAVNWGAPLKPNGTAEMGVYWDLPYRGSGTLNFIIHDGDKKDTEQDQSFPSPATKKEAFVISGDPIIYTGMDEAKKNAGNRIEKAMITGEKEITVYFRTKPMEPIKLLLNNVTIPILQQTAIADNRYILQCGDKVDALQKYTIRSGEMTGYTQTDWRSIDAGYSYSGDLGCFYKPTGTEFKLWAPLASAVVLNLYHSREENPAYQSIPLTKGEKGVWYAKVNGDRKNQFYTYTVTNNGVAKEILDPYAKSMAAFNSEVETVGKAAIVDPSAIGPALQYAQIAGYTKREDTIIWEVHVRDFTSDPDLVTQAPFGTYKAFIEKLDYIKSLGVTHVQLLPVMNYYFGDELKNNVRETEYSSQNNNYNWGYDPHNYFTPEGMYSTNPSDPSLRIAELKELINEIHKRGMGVILDNVYNHTAKVSILEDIVPGYYHFMDKDGKPKMSYGGGRPGTTHFMTRKLITDSMLYWVREYKVDGFRFDLMGDLDAQTVQSAYEQASKLNPNIVFIGEGWRTYSGDDGDKREAADQDGVAKSDAYACFSDEMRNELKSGFGSEGQPRFITGGARSIQTIFNNISGKPGNMSEDDPGDVVQYIEAHDNLTLHDVIAYTIRKDPASFMNEVEIQKRIRIGNALILTSQGIAFLHAGQEYGRTKQWFASTQPQDKFTKVDGFAYPYFIHDSYDASDAINKFDWDKVTNPGVQKQTMEYTAGLIKLRRYTDAFRLGSEDKVRTNVKMIRSQDIMANDLLIAYQCNATDGTEYYVFVNADRRTRQINTDLNLTHAETIVDSDEAGISPVTKLTGIKALSKGGIEIDPLTVIVMRKPAN